MKIFKTFLVIGCSLLVVACSMRSNPVGSPQALERPSPKPSPAEAGYTGENEALYYYIEGLKAHNIDFNIVMASRHFDKAIELDSTMSAAYFAAANNLAMADPELALQYSTKANSLDTSNIWFKSQMGRLMIFTGRYDQALDTYKKLIAINPSDPDNYRMLAALYEFTNNPFTAIAILDSAVNRFGMIEELTSFRLELLVKVKLYDKAIAESQDVINLFPYNYENYLILAQLYAATGKDSLAMENFRKAQELNPGSIDIIVAMNEYYGERGDNTNYLATAKDIFRSDEIPLEHKIIFFEELISDREYYSENFFPISDLASTLLVKYPLEYKVIDLYANNMIAFGNIEEALRIYKSYVEGGEPELEAFNSILDIESYLDRPDSVNKYTELALLKFPDNPELYMRQGYGFLYMKRGKQAIEKFEKALSYSPGDSLSAAILGSIGDAWHELGNNSKSYSFYDKALKKDPDNIIVLNNYAYFLSLEEKQLEKALEMSARVMELAPGNPTYLDTYGWILYKLGRYDEAKKILQLAVSLDRHGSKELYLHYGDILYALEDNFMASVYWEKALEAGYDAEEIAGRMDKVKK